MNSVTVVINKYRTQITCISATADVSVAVSRCGDASPTIKVICQYFCKVKQKICEFPGRVVV